MNKFVKKTAEAAAFIALMDAGVAATFLAATIY